MNLGTPGNCRISDIMVSGEGKKYELNRGSEYGPPGTFLINTMANTTIVDWSFDVNDEKRTFDVSYTVENAVQAYNDVAELKREIVPQNNETEVGQLFVKIKTPPITNNYTFGKEIMAWVHGPIRGKTEYTKAHEIMFETLSVRPDDKLEVRVMMPVDLFPHIPMEFREDKSMAETIIKREETALKTAESGRDRKKNPSIIKVLLKAIFVPAIICGLLYLALRWAKKNRDRFGSNRDYNDYRRYYDDRDYHRHRELGRRERNLRNRERREYERRRSSSNRSSSRSSRSGSSSKGKYGGR